MSDEATKSIDIAHLRLMLSLLTTDVLGYYKYYESSQTHNLLLR